MSPAGTGNRTSFRRVLLTAAGGATKFSVPQRVGLELPKKPKVLLIRPDHLGDLLLTSPAVELLRNGLPDAHLTMLVGPWSTDVASRDPLLDEVLTLPFPGFTRGDRGSPLAPYALLCREAATLKRRRFDAALVLRFDHWWGAWLSALAGIPIRIGFGVKECQPFLTHMVQPSERVHWSEQSLEVARRLLRLKGKPQAVEATEPLGLRFGVRPEDLSGADRMLEELQLDPGRVVVAFHPGSGSPLKLWSEDSWVELGQALASKGAQLLVTGNGAEAGVAARIAAAVPGGLSLAGKTELGTLAAVYSRCNLVVGTDNGPLHLAVALDVPSLRLFGPTDPAVFGPWGDTARHRVVTGGWADAPCSRLDLETPDGSPPPCMCSIGVEAVARECEALLGAV